MATERDRIEQAEKLDTFWDDLIRGDRSHYAHSADEEFDLIERLLAVAPIADPEALERLTQRSIGDPQFAAATSTSRKGRVASPRRRARQERELSPEPSTLWSRIGPIVSFGATMALIIALLGAFWLLNRDRGWVGLDGSSDNPTLSPAQLAATPQTNLAQDAATPLAESASVVTAGARQGILWQLSPAGADVDSSYATSAGDVIYRMSRTGTFTGIEAIDVASGSVQWSLTLDWTGSGLDADERAIYLPVRGSTGEIDAVVALDTSDGTELWRSEATSRVESLAVDGDVVYAWEGYSALTAIDGASGDSLWQSVTNELADRATVDPQSISKQEPVVIGNRVMVIDALGQIIAFDSQTGQQAWMNVGLAAGTGELIAAGDGTLLGIGLEPFLDGATQPGNLARLVAIDPSTGAVNWQKDITSISPSALVVGQTVVLLADIPFRSPGTVTLVEGDGTQREVEVTDDRLKAPVRVYGLDLATGELVIDRPPDPTVYNATGRAWASNQGDPGFSRLATYGQDDSHVLAISGNGRITALAAGDGHVTGIVDAGTPATETLVSDAGTFALLIDGSLISLDREVLAGSGGVNAAKSDDPDSAIDWTLPLPDDQGAFQSLGAMVVSNGIVYRTIETSSGKWVQAVHGPTGQLAWTVQIDWMEGGLLAHESGIYVVTAESRLVSLDPYSGDPRWELPFVEAGVVGMALGNHLYVQSGKDAIVAIDPESGERIWEQQMSSFVDSAAGLAAPPQPLVVDDMVVVIDSAGIVNAIGQETGELAWSQRGFEGMSTRMAGQEGVLLILSSAEEGQLTGTALDLETGEMLWTIGLDGPLFQPVATNDAFFLIADEMTELSALDEAYDPIEDFSAPGSQGWIGSKASMEEDAGGSHVFGIDGSTGETIWSRSSMAGGFVQLGTGWPNSWEISALTADGQLISLAWDNGAIDGFPTLYPMVFGSAPLAVSDFGFGELGSFATLEDGTLINYGATPFNEMG